LSRPELYGFKTRAAAKVVGGGLALAGVLTMGCGELQTFDAGSETTRDANADDVFHGFPPYGGSPIFPDGGPIDGVYLTPDATRDSEVDAAGAESGTLYTGWVEAYSESQQGKLYYSLSTGFYVGASPPANPLVTTCETTVGSCCWQTTALAGPGPGPPNANAGNVTIDLNQLPLATLIAPSSGGNYTESDNATWGAGDPLGVSAAGGAVAAFSGILHTPAAISGLNPAFGTTPVAIALGSDFQVSWTPEGKEGEVMILEMSPQIFCSVPDSAGSVMVDASLFAALGSSTMGDISLVRVIASNLSAANATISLRGYFTLDVPAIYEATGDATDAGDGG
jgi:hypothetical protein